MLEKALAGYRSAIRAIEAELDIRRKVSGATRADGLRAMLRELTPARCPRMAAPSSEIERLAVASCDLSWGQVRAFLAESSFLRVRRHVRGRNVYLYQFGFGADAERSFVALRVRGE